jgi:hypothetical protein
LHLVGDYWTQSSWMTNNKGKRSWPCLLHALLYSLPFFFIGTWPAVLVIFVTHFIIDRTKIIHWLIWVKNAVLSPEYWMARNTFEEYESEYEWNLLKAKYDHLDWQKCRDNGSPPDTPVWLAVKIRIICDNTVHLLINYLALTYL